MEAPTCSTGVWAVSGLVRLRRLRRSYLGHRLHQHNHSRHARASFITSRLWRTTGTLSHRCTADSELAAISLVVRQCRQPCGLLRYPVTERRPRRMTTQGDGGVLRRRVRRSLQLRRPTLVAGRLLPAHHRRVAQALRHVPRAVRAHRHRRRWRLPTPAGECVFFTVMICFWFLNLYDNSDIHFPFFSFLS